MHVYYVWKTMNSVDYFKTAILKKPPFFKVA